MRRQKKVFIAPLLSCLSLFLTSCATSSAAPVPDCEDGLTHSERIAKTTEERLKRYGNPKLRQTLLSTHISKRRGDYDAVLSFVSEGLALPGLSSYGRAVLYREQGNTLYKLKKTNQSILAFEKALAEDSLEDYDNTILSDEISSLKTSGFVIADARKAGLVVNADAYPLVRIPPIMPPKATQSGHCKLQFDVSPNGTVENIRSTYCTESLFEAASIKSLSKWKYRAKVENGKAVTRKDAKTKISFRLTDICGRIKPEAESL